MMNLLFIAVTLYVSENDALQEMAANDGASFSRNKVDSINKNYYVDVIW